MNKSSSTELLGVAADDLELDGVVGENVVHPVPLVRVRLAVRLEVIVKHIVSGLFAWGCIGIHEFLRKEHPFDRSFPASL